MARPKGVSYLTYNNPTIASPVIPEKPRHIGDRYTSYKPTRGGTLTIVNLTSFSKWLSEQVREKERLDAQVLQRSADTRSTRQTSKGTRTHKSRALTYA